MLTVRQQQPTPERKEKEKFTLFSDHSGSLLRRQPGAAQTCLQALKRYQTSPTWSDLAQGAPWILNLFLI